MQRHFHPLSAPGIVCDGFIFYIDHSAHFFRGEGHLLCAQDGFGCGFIGFADPKHDAILVDTADHVSVVWPKILPMAYDSKKAGFLLVSVLMCILCGSCGSAPLGADPSMDAGVAFSEDSARILRRMAEQEEAWSSGDLNGFMEPYWKSDSLLFVGSRGPSRGWQVTLDNYRKSYPSADAMGKLTFEVEDLEPAGTDHALMLGKWHLARGEGLDDLAGWFSLVWRRINGDWVIIRDHSS